jgi:hypothetical protein
MNNNARLPLGVPLGCGGFDNVLGVLVAQHVDMMVPLSFDKHEYDFICYS